MEASPKAVKDSKET